MAKAGREESDPQPGKNIIFYERAEELGEFLLFGESVDEEMRDPEDDQRAPENSDFSPQIFRRREVGGVAGLLLEFVRQPHGAGPVGGEDGAGDEIGERMKHCAKCLIDEVARR